MSRTASLTYYSPSTKQVPRSIFIPLITIFDTKFDAVQDNLDRLYTVVGNYCRNGEIVDAESLGLLEQALLVPISKDSGTRASRSFALCFLAQPNLKLFEANVAAFANNIDMGKLSPAIVDAYATGWASTQTAEARLWLLAHFIGLGNAKQNMSLGSSYLNAMYIQLSSLQPELKRHQIGRGPMTPADVSDAQKRLPPFIEKAVESLVGRDELSHLLGDFTT